jgi:8-oxo-dGTP diphosphatase
MQQRIVNGGFIVHEGKFLLMKRADNDTFLPGVWEIPGGKLEFGENPLDGAKREIKEEAGLDIELVSSLSIWTYVDYSG